jgi:hypothetical protein
MNENRTLATLINRLFTITIILCYTVCIFYGIKFILNPMWSTGIQSIIMGTCGLVLLIIKLSK